MAITCSNLVQMKHVRYFLHLQKTQMPKKHFIHQIWSSLRNLWSFKVRNPNTDRVQTKGGWEDGGTSYPPHLVHATLSTSPRLHPIRSKTINFKKP
jgi:hypothetical protein